MHSEQKQLFIDIIYNHPRPKLCQDQIKLSPVSYIYIYISNIEIIQTIQIFLYWKA